MLPHSEPEQQARGLHARSVRVRRDGKRESYLAVGERESGTARHVGRWRGRSAVGGRPVQLRLAARSQRGRSGDNRPVQSRLMARSQRGRSVGDWPVQSRLMAQSQRGRSADEQPVQSRLVARSQRDRCTAGSVAAWCGRDEGARGGGTWRVRRCRRVGKRAARDAAGSGAPPQCHVRRAQTESRPRIVARWRANISCARCEVPMSATWSSVPQ